MFCFILCSRCSLIYLLYTPCAEPFKPYQVAISAQNNNTGEVNTDIVFSREGSEFMQISQGIDFIILPGAGLICQ